MRSRVRSVLIVVLFLQRSNISLNIDTTGQDDDVGGETDLHRTETSAGSKHFVYEGFSEI